MFKNVYVDFHVLQTVPPSCINRDDTGSPKTAVYGGKTRARVSSQAWKRAIRLYFKDIFSEDQIGYRTKNVKALLAKTICEIDSGVSEEEAEKLAKSVIEVSDIKSGGDKKAVLFFISSNQVRALAKKALELKSDKKKDKEKAKEFKEVLNSNPSIDMVMFGRMAANDPTLNYDAAVQVAHSISTHAVSNEYDYFTAVDDYQEDDNAGAGHLGTVEFNSSTLYRYATINVREMKRHLENDEIIQAVKGFAEAFIKSMPTGKQNTFANRTLPDMVYVTVRIDQPINLAGAFEKPIVAGEEGYSDKSRVIFEHYTQEIWNNWASEPKAHWYIGKDSAVLGQRVTFPELLESLDQILSKMLVEIEGE